ncbi:MAG TPA: hypothetical protein VGN26_23360 [Armatimonadota bacterium]
MMGIRRCSRLQAHWTELGPDAEPSESLRSHLSACPACRRDWKALERGSAMLAQARESWPEAPAPRLLALARLRAQVQAQSSPPSGRRFLIPVPRAAAAGLCLGAAACAAALYVSSTQHGAGRGQTVAVRTPAEKPQVEPPDGAGSGLGDGGGAEVAARQAQGPSSAVPVAPRKSIEVAPGGGYRAHPEQIAALGGKILPGAGPRGVVGDLEYINAPYHPSSVPAPKPRALPAGDDFVIIDLPQIAAADSPATRAIVAEAMSDYQAEKAIVDPRLAAKIDLDLKGSDLAELVPLLAQKTGAKLLVDKGLEDLKLTILCKQQPVRDVMRQVVRLLNLEWHRHKTPQGGYWYGLSQNLKQRLAEEELRRKDQDQMLLGLAKTMEPLLDYKDASKEELQTLAEGIRQKIQSAATYQERQRLMEQERVLLTLSQDTWRNVLKAYAGLSSDRLVALRNGEKVVLTYGDGEQTLPRDWAASICAGMGEPFNEGAPDSEPEALKVQLGFSLDHDRPDKAQLTAFARLEKGNGTHQIVRQNGVPLTTGQPDLLSIPGNAARHASLAGKPEWASRLTLDPPASDMAGALPARADLEPGPGRSKLGVEKPSADRKGWVRAADILALLRQKTGLDVVADDYTRVYPRSLFSFSNARRLDVVNQVADALGSQWEQDGGFLRFRRVNYYSERLMDVPNRLLRRWKAARERQGYLNLDDLAELAVLPGDVLKHSDLTRAVLLEYGLQEWRLLPSGAQYLNLYSMLSPSERQQVRAPQGLAVGDLSPEKLQALIALRPTLRPSFGPSSPDEIRRIGRLYMRVREPGHYEWFDRNAPADIAVPVVAQLRGQTKEEVAAAMQAAMKLMGIPPEQAADQARNIAGPGAAILVRVQVGDLYSGFQVEHTGTNGWTTGGSFGGSSGGSSGGGSGGGFGFGSGGGTNGRSSGGSGGGSGESSGGGTVRSGVR